MVVPKLPILTSWRRRDVLLLVFSLNVGLLVLGGVENGLRLLRSHARHRLGCRRLIWTLGRRRRRRLALASATTSASTAATSSASAILFLSQRELVIPTPIRVRYCHLDDLLVPIERTVEGRVGRVLGLEALHQVIEA